MGQGSSQPEADKSPAKPKSAASSPVAFTAPTSPNASSDGKREPDVVLHDKNDQSFALNLQISTSEEVHADEAPSVPSTGGLKSKSRPNRVTKPEKKTEKMAKKAKVRKAVRNGVEQLSKTDFLSALNGDINPDEVKSSDKTDRSVKEIESSQQTPVSSHKTPGASGEDPSKSVPSSTSPQKRKLTYSNKTPNGGLTKKIRHVATPDPEVLSSLAPISKFDNSTASPETQLTPRPPVQATHDQVPGPSHKQIKVVVPASEQDTKSSPFQIARPSQPRAKDLYIAPVQRSSSQATWPNHNDNPDKVRQAALAENYSKGIGKVDRKRSDRPLAEVIQNQGQFTVDELDKVHNFRKTWCDEHGKSEEAFDALLHASTRSDPDAKQIWMEIYEMYPYRKSHTLNKILRRHFHPFSRSIGWTKEEDQELRENVNLLGKKWKDIAYRINRRPEDCRDRWRNYLQYSNRRIEAWDANEILALGHAVGDLMYKVLVDRRQQVRRQSMGATDLTNDEYRKLIDWHAVALKVPGRSRLQCLQQWHYMEEKGKITFQTEVALAEERATGNQMPKSQPKPRLLAGDKLRLCKAIAETDSVVLDLEEIRSESSKLQIFPKHTLLKAWKDLQADYLTDADHVDEELDMTEAAALVRRRLRKAISKDQRKEHWVQGGSSEIGTPQSPSVQDYAAKARKRQEKAAQRKKGEVREIKSEDTIKDSEPDTDE